MKRIETCQLRAQFAERLRSIDRVTVASPQDLADVAAIPEDAAAVTRRGRSAAGIFRSNVDNAPYEKGVR